MSDTAVDLLQLRANVDRLLVELIRQHGPTFEFTSDYYWAIQDPRLSDPSQEGPDVTIGQISETQHFLESDPQKWEGGSESLLGTPLRWVSNMIASVAAELEQG